MSAGRNLVIVSSRAPFGNKEPYLRTELGELVKHFQRVAVVPVRTPEGDRQELPQEVEVLAWPLISAEILRRAVLAAISHPVRVARAIGSVVFSREAGLVKNLAVSLKALALAQWVGEANFDHIHAYWVSTPATVAMIAARVAGVTWSATAHRWDIYERNAFDAKMRDAAFIRAISERGRQDLRSAMPSARERIVRVPIGAEIPQVRHETTNGKSGLRIVCPAALIEIKGHDDLLDALALLRERGVPFRCTLAGEGALRDRLAERIGELGLAGAVDLPGFVPQNELHRRYMSDAYNVVVLSSRQHANGLMEGIPSALVEAMAFGIPVVATDSGSVGELVDASCGRLVAASDPHALADALEQVYADPEQARERAARAYERVATQHNVRVQMRDFAAMIGGERSVT